MRHPLPRPATFVIEAFDEAFKKGRQEIFNTDQGSPFTTREFASKLTEASIEISFSQSRSTLRNLSIETATPKPLIRSAIYCGGG